jgi:prolyl 4-hydroxylase
MRQEHLDGADAFVIHDFLTPEECAAFTAAAEAVGFTDAPITTSRGFVMRPDIRNNTRVIIDNHSWADLLWERLRALPLPTRHGAAPSGLNERLRFYRYDPGQSFNAHHDGHYERPDGSERSFYTVMVYLNQRCTGGHTWFPRGDLSVPPETGKALVFYHRQLHEGQAVQQGRKYVLRTDLMYPLRCPSLTASS